MAEAVLNRLAANAGELADKLLGTCKGKVVAGSKQADAILAVVAYLIGRPKGDKGLTVHVGSESLGTVHAAVGYPKEQCPAELDQGDDPGRLEGEE